MKKIILTLFFALSICSVFGQTSWTNPLLHQSNIIKGRSFNDDISDYSRLPIRFKDRLRTPLWNLSQNSAGLSLCFKTNSTEITVRYTVSGWQSMVHMPATGVSGVDLYTTDQNGEQYWLRGHYSFGDTISYTFRDIKYKQDLAFGQEFELYLPLYNSVKWLEIGVKEGSKIEFLDVTKERPVVVYGTSIAQGACASRPAMAWTNILARQTKNHIINLGFSGNGQLEQSMFDLMGEIDAKLFIIDCMPNMVNNLTDSIYSRTITGVHNLRERSNAPILLVEHSGYMNDSVNQYAYNQPFTSNKELKRAYEELISEGVSGLVYMTKDQFHHTMDCQVDGVHPTDLGMQQQADGYTKVVNRILNQEPGILQTQTPVKQDRDAFSYNWNKRHEKTLKFNSEKQPSILMIGNSITHFWGEEVSKGRQNGVKVWEKLFKNYVVSNMGFGWDKIENVLYRVYHGELDGFDAKKIFISIGSNNLASNNNSEIVEGLDFLIKAIRVRQPKAKIYLQYILPREGFESRIKGLNSMILDKFINTDVVINGWGDEFYGADGKVDKGLLYDGCHPTEEGYEILAKYIKNSIQK